MPDVTATEPGASGASNRDSHSGPCSGPAGDGPGRKSARARGSLEPEPLRRRFLLRFPVLLLVCVVLLILVPPGVVGLIYRRGLAFDPWVFINEWFKFSGGLLSIFLAFWLTSMYWQRKLRSDAVAYMMYAFYSDLEDIGRITFQTSKALTDTSETIDKRLAADSEVLANLRRLGDYSARISRLLDTSWNTFQDNEVIRASRFFEAEINPLLTDLKARPTVRPFAAEIERDLARLGRSVESLIMFISGGTHALDQTG